MSQVAVKGDKALLLQIKDDKRSGEIYMYYLIAMQSWENGNGIGQIADSLQELTDNFETQSVDSNEETDTTTCIHVYIEL